MKHISTIVALVCLTIGAGLFMGGCGGRSDSGAVATLSAPPETRGTLKLTNLTDGSVVTVDGVEAAAASGTLTMELATGRHSVSVYRVGYTVDNAAELSNVTVTVNGVTEKAVAFTEEAPPLPDGWVVE